MREKQPLIQEVLASYVPLNNAAMQIEAGYKDAFFNVVANHFEQDEVKTKFGHYLRLIGQENAALSDAQLKHFFVRLLDRLSNKEGFNQVDDNTEKSISTAIDAELATETLSAAQQELLRLAFSEHPEVQQSVGPAFESQVTEVLSAPEYQERFAQYLANYAELANTNAFIQGAQVPNPDLITRFIHNVLNRLMYQRKSTIKALKKAKIEAGVDADDAKTQAETEANTLLKDKKLSTIAAINQELGWYGKFKKENSPQHSRPQPAPGLGFSPGEYVVENIILGCSTYALDDGVTAIDRPIKNGAYASGDPNYDFSKATGGIKIANDAHTYLMYAYFGVTALSFLVVPARCIYRALTVGWEDRVIKGKKKTGLKNTLTDRDTIVEFAINTAIVIMTGLAVFATTFIVWPVVIGLFSVGLFAAIYGAVVTKQGAKENLRKLTENNAYIKENSPKLDAYKGQLRAEFAKGTNYNPATFAKLSEKIRLLTDELEKRRAENHNLAINQKYNDSFFGKYGVYIKVGISAATVVAYTLLATAIFSASAVFFPSLIVMSVLGAAALTYFVVKQYKAYQEEKKRCSAHIVTDGEVDALVSNSQKNILSGLKVKLGFGQPKQNRVDARGDYRQLNDREHPVADNVKPIKGRSSSFYAAPRAASGDVSYAEQRKKTL